MARIYRKESIIKAVKISDVTVQANQTVQTLENHGIVHVGDRAGVVFDKVDNTTVTICFSTDFDFATMDYVEASLPSVGGKIYLNAEGKLDNVNTGKLVGYYWGKLETGDIVFSLAG